MSNLQAVELSAAEANAAAMSSCRMLKNTAGEYERERCSRLFNALEGLGVMTFVLVVLWPFAYLCGWMPGNETVHTIANILLFTGAFYLLFVSPFIHRDTLDSWGLGDPRRLWRMLTTGAINTRLSLSCVLLFIFAALNYMNYTQWPEVVHFLNLDKTLAADFRSFFWGRVAVVTTGSLVSLFILTYCIRYDNFFSAFKTAMVIALPLLCIAFLAAFVHRGISAFTSLNLQAWMLGVFGYVFWGFIQQLLFSAYFGTRFRKGFAPSTAAANVVAPQKRWRVRLWFALGAAITAPLLTAIGVRASYGADSNLELTHLLWMALFLFPLGGIYGHFYCKDRKRMLVTTLCAACFGMIHIASYALVAVTWGLGIVLVYVFMEAKNRNLVALGFIHGLLGSSFGQLFSKGKSGTLEVDYAVGPWHVEHPTFGVLIFPMLCIALFIGLIYWSTRNIREIETI